MGKDELEAWLCGTDPRGPTSAELIILTGSDSRSLAAPLLRSIRFVLAVLRDVYADDAAVWRWLLLPRLELSGARAADLMCDGRAAEIEARAVSEWNASRSVRATPSRDGFPHGPTVRKLTDSISRLPRLAARSDRTHSGENCNGKFVDG